MAAKVECVKEEERKQGRAVGGVKRGVAPKLA
jgi:hypothetical protein